LVVAFTISFLFQLQSHCNSSRCSVINFELSFFPSHVEEERLHAFRPLIIQVTFISLQCTVQQLHIPPGWGLNVSNKYCSAIKLCLSLNIQYISKSYYFLSPLILLLHTCFALVCCKILQIFSLYPLDVCNTKVIVNHI